MHLELDDAIVTEIDTIAGARRRSAFVREAVMAAVDRHRRASRLRQAAGVLRDGGHDWDDDPAAWVRRQRTAAHGTTLSQADCLIAAVAQAAAAVLATGTPRHFPMTDVEVEHWPVGE
jgi:predicted nucleic acid-binding protein